MIDYNYLIREYVKQNNLFDDKGVNDGNDCASARK